MAGFIGAGAPAAPHSLAPLEDETSAHPFQFTGKAGDYFRIWIVNVALSIVTLGVYSAWAKVRRKQYFYRNTLLDGSSFEYLANPISILKGRLIVAAALIAVTVAGQISEVLSVVGFILLALASPWVFVRALGFNARNSSWRNVRFGFHGTTKEALREYSRGILITLVTLGIGSSWMQWNLLRFGVEKHSFGKEPLAYRTVWTQFFTTTLLAIALLFAMIFIIVIPLVLLTPEGVGPAGPSAAMSVFLPVAIALPYFVMFAFLRTRHENLIWGGIDVGSHRLVSNQRFPRVLWLQFTNVLAIACTLGLAVPWAKVRTVRYRLECLTLHATGPLVAEADPTQQREGAVGDAFADLGDFDLGFG